MDMSPEQLNRLQQQIPPNSKPLLINKQPLYAALLTPRPPGQYVAVGIHGLPDDARLVAVQESTDGRIAAHFQSHEYASLAINNDLRALPADHLYCSAIVLPCQLDAFVDYCAACERVAELASTLPDAADELQQAITEWRQFREAHGLDHERGAGGDPAAS